MEPRLQNLRQLFEPRSVAFVGASDKIRKWGFIILNNILHGGWTGPLYPVNPNREEVLGRKAYPTVSAIPGPVDLAVITVPAAAVRATLADCAAKGVKAAVVISAGFKEMGGAAAGMEAEMVAEARAAGMVLVGPNGQGVCSPANRFFAWMPHFCYPQAGPVAVISQSGNVQAMMIRELIELNLGVSRCVSSGNEADLRMEDYLAFLADDPQTKVILSYVEGVSDGRRFQRMAAETARKKPVVLLKGGRSSLGMSAASSHTGALAVSDEIFAAACRQAGVIVADSIRQSVAIAAGLVGRPLPRGRRVGILTGGGGLGVVAADVCARTGLQVPVLSEAVIEKLRGLMPAWWVPGNPVDLVAGLDFTHFPAILDTLLGSGEIDSLLFLFIGADRTEKDLKPLNDQTRKMEENWKKMSSFYGGFQKALADLMVKFGIPIIGVSSFGDEYERAHLGELSPERSVFLRDTETAVEALAAMTRYAEFRK